MKKRLNLIKERAGRGLRQDQIAKIIGVTPATYSHLENGRSNSKPEVWDKLEGFFGIHQRVLREVFTLRKEPE
jgi:DNA-binding XRE family transcriptional regulator